MADDLIDDLRVFNEGDDPHLSSASRTEEGGNFIELADHLRPPSGATSFSNKS